MKKKLLSIALFLTLAVSLTSAQTKVWDLGGNAAPWLPANSPFTTSQVIDNLGLVIQSGTGTANFGAINASAKTFATTPAYTSVNRFQLNGGGSAPAGTFLPVQRYLTFKAAGSITVEVLFIGGGSGDRTLYITDGTKSLGSLTTTDSTTPQILTTTAATVNGNVYIYGDQSLNLYRIKVTGPLGTTTLATSDLSVSKIKNNIFSSGNQLYISKVTSATKVSVYDMNGGLVKTFNTKSDTNVPLKAGLYIVNTQFDKGSASQKVIIK